MTRDWHEVGSGVHVLRHESYDLNIGLVVGADACLVIDTRASHRQARELAGAIRRITPHPWTVVNTHAHFDHYFGNAVFRPARIWGHLRCAEIIRDYGAAHRAAACARARLSESAPETESQAECECDHGSVTAADFAEVRIDPPDQTFEESVTLDIGGRAVELRHLGRGHTDNDIVIRVPDANVVFAGDLVEEGAPPQFDDAFPLDWTDTLRRLHSMITGPVVPGHGAVVDRAFVERQAGELAETARIAREAFAAGQSIEEASTATPFPAGFARVAVARAFRQLAGAPPYDSPEQRLTEPLSELE